MKFVLAPDSFKGCLTSQQAAQAMNKGIKQAASDARIIMSPMADGGEGTTQALVDALNGDFIKVKTIDPLGHPIYASYGLVKDNQIAVIEMSAASGIQFINPQFADPGKATTYGTGLIIKDALQHHVKRIIVGLGGSATNDGGSGMAAALGVKFLNANNHSFKPCGNNLDQLAHLDLTHVNPLLRKVPITIASDVTNPLCGPQGASAVFGPQKGADPQKVKRLDQNLRHYAMVIKKDLDKDIVNYPGAGAAGGLGAGLLAFTTCRLQPGVKVVMKLTQLKSELQNADVVVTGEGSIDRQTQYGKVPVGVASLAKAVNPHCKVIALGGHIGKNLQPLYQKGIDTILPIVPGAMSLAEAIKKGAMNLTLVTYNLTRLLK